MPKKNSPSTVNQTAIGDDNIQVVGSNNVITRITNFFTGGTEQQRDKRNRRDMLKLVKKTWIKGVLEKSLYNEVLIELGLEERPGAVDHPWDMQVQMPNQINRRLPAGTSLMEVFDEMNGAMLILGEPGAGKTTVLLELARDMIAQAEQDISLPIPVVLNLSTWPQTEDTGWRYYLLLLRRLIAYVLTGSQKAGQPINDWLVSELVLKYSVQTKTAERWIMNDNLLLLLDGLDEVKSNDQESCVIAINDFRRLHGDETPIVVCSRIADYEVLNIQLSLQGAVLLQPLTSQQIEEYFERTGSGLDSVHRLLQNDSVLQELARQPLMLSIITLAYRDISVDVLASEQMNTIETRRKHLFDTYIRQMFRRVRTKNELYSSEQTKGWLTWLAQKMIEQGRSIFLIEQIQQGWLETRDQQLLYRVIVGPFCGFLLSIFAGLFVGLVGWLKLGNTVKPIELVGTGLFIMLTDLLFLGLTYPELKAQSFYDVNISQSMKKSITAMLVSGLLIGLFDRKFGTFVGTFGGKLDGFALGPLIGPLIGLYYDGYVVISHFTLRFLLYQGSYVPWNYIRFLNYADDRIFLRRVGRGYIFVHRLLMEHFAVMETEGT